jgi:hypothetical protein
MKIIVVGAGYKLNIIIKQGMKRVLLGDIRIQL